MATHGPVTEGAQQASPPPQGSSSFRIRLAAASASLLVGVGLMASKFYVYRLTGSSAFLSDALESIINVVAAAFALTSVVIAARPPDATHPYGHGKIEYFSVGFEGAMIIGAAIGIVLKAWPQILQPRPLPNLGDGLVISSAISSVNLALGAALIGAGKRTNSITLIADGKHVLTDVFTSLGVVLGMLVVWFTGWIWMDGVVACLVALNILFTGWNLIRHSFSSLMDASDPDLLEEIAQILNRHRKEDWIDIHQLRARRYGSFVHLDFHLILPREFTLDRGHREVKELQRIFQSHYGEAVDVNIHVDPCSESECRVCSHDPCLCRKGDPIKQRLWHRDVIINGPERETERREKKNEDGNSSECDKR